MVSHNLACILVSGFSGILSSSSYGIVSYVQHRANARGIRLTRCNELLLTVVNMVFSLSGVAVFWVSSKLGPVSVAMPIQTASLLLWNMLVQGLGGIVSYSKPMQLGTWILVVAATCLMDVGPTDPDWDGMDAMTLLTARSWLWIVIMLLGMLSSLITLLAYFHRKRTKTMGFAVFVALTTALGATLGKMLFLTSGTAWLCCAGAYFCMGCGCILGARIAAAQCDMSVYLPIAQCIQLSANGLTGLIVWGDAPRIQAPTPYLLIFAIMMLSVFLVSDLEKGGDQSQGMDQALEAMH